MLPNGEDFYTWTQDQAAAIRRADGRAELDVEHLAEEVEDLGKRDLREVKSYLELVLTHLLKLEAEPDAPSVPHWRAETRAFARAAAKAFSPGMGRHIDLALLWDEVTANFAIDREEQGLSAAPARPCPFALTDLITLSLDVDAALSTLSDARGA